LLVDARITYAALILFGTRTALGRWLAQAELVFEYRSSEASGPAADREEFREGFFLWHDAIWNKINLRNDRQSYQDGLFRIELPTFDEVSVREVLLNAVAHRDYRLGGSVFVRQYSQRLEATCQIQVLLRELRKEQAIHNVGLTKRARWFPGPASANCNSNEPS
jgi:ATP-dependent DNA helicase RecG